MKLDWFKIIIWLIIILLIIFFWIGLASFVFGIDQLIDVTTNPFATTQTIAIESIPDQVIMLDYSNAQFTTGLASILATENLTITQVTINIVNMTDGIYTDIVRVNNSVTLVNYNFILNVSAGFFNTSQRFIYTVDSLPWSIIENISLTIAPGREIRLFYEDWFSGSETIITSESGITIIPVNITIPEGTGPSQYVKTLTLSINNETQEHLNFYFDVLELVEPCRDLFNAYKAEEDPLLVLKKVSEYIICLESHKPVRIINTTITEIIPGDVRQWYEERHRAEIELIAAKDAIIASNDQNLRQLRVDLDKERSEKEALNSTLTAVYEAHGLQIQKIDEETVSLWVMYILLTLIGVMIIGVSGYIYMENKVM